MRKRSTRYFIIAIIAFILVVSGVYAILTTTLNITGTSTGTASFKLEFSNASVSDTNKASYTINADGTVLTVNTNLSYPGDSATINFAIKNTGTLNAKVDKLTVNNNSNPDLNVQIVGLSSIEGTTLAVGNTTSGSIVVTWNTASTNETPDNVTFSITIDYSQSTT